MLWCGDGLCVVIKKTTLCTLIHSLCIPTLVYCVYIFSKVCCVNTYIVLVVHVYSLTPYVYIVNLGRGGG